MCVSVFVDMCESLFVNTCVVHIVYLDLYILCVPVFLHVCVSVFVVVFQLFEVVDGEILSDVLVFQMLKRFLWSSY